MQLEIGPAPTVHASVLEAFPGNTEEEKMFIQGSYLLRKTGKVMLWNLKNANSRSGKVLEKYKDPESSGKVLEFSLTKNNNM